GLAGLPPGLAGLFAKVTVVRATDRGSRVARRRRRAQRGRGAGLLRPGGGHAVRARRGTGPAPGSVGRRGGARRGHGRRAGRRVRAADRPARRRPGFPALTTWGAIDWRAALPRS